MLIPIVASKPIYQNHSKAIYNFYIAKTNLSIQIRVNCYPILLYSLILIALLIMVPLDKAKYKNQIT